MSKDSVNALFFNVPGHGHVNPSLPLVAELARRGHRITYFITPAYRNQVVAVGAVFEAYEEITDDYFKGPKLDGSSPQFAAYTLLKTTEEILPGLLQRAQTLDPDYILFDGMCPWGYWVAKVLGLPSVASMSLLQFGRPNLRAILDRNMIRLFLAVMTKDTGKGLEANRISQRLGKVYNVPHLGPTSLLNAFGDISLAYTSAAFQPFSDSMHPSIRFVGRSHPANPSFPDGFFDPVADRSLVYCSLGSIINDNRHFFQLCIDAFADRDEYVMISTGRRFEPADFGSIPENVAVHPWVPQAAVLERAALFISHGGLNSVHDALYFGVPLLLIPQQDEQTLNAGRVEALGAGLSLAGKKLTKELLVSRVERFLKEAHFMENAAILGETLRQAGGIEAAADEVEGLLNREKAGDNIKYG